jgi:hypothetical protein
MAKYGRPVISRETRLLLITLMVSISALWLLARLRFQDKPATAVPVVPVLAQLRPQSSYDDLAHLVSNLRPRVAAAIAVGARGVAALRIGRDTGVGVALSHFELVQLPEADVPSITAWNPRIVDYPRYLLAAEFVDEHLSLRPVFVGSLVTVESRLWNGSIWRLPPRVGLWPGTFVFTLDGLLAGLTIEDGGALSLIPGSLVLESAARITEHALKVPGDLGIEVQQTPLGLAIARVDPDGPANDALTATEVVEALNGQSVATIADWDAHARTITAGDRVMLRVRSGRETRDVAIVAVTVVYPPEDPSLGLRLRNVARTGVAVLSVEPRSRADRAGIHPGDLITVINGLKSPTAAHVTRMFEALPSGGMVLAAVTRGDTYHVVAIERMHASP